MVGGRTCRCGARGCLEAYAGAEAILDRYGGPLPGTDQESALTALIDLAATSARAAEVMDETALYLGVSIGNLINLFNPERPARRSRAGVIVCRRASFPEPSSTRSWWGRFPAGVLTGRFGLVSTH